jgi:hypothetical protein
MLSPSLTEPIITSKWFGVEVVVAAPLQQFILEGEFGEVPKPVVVVLPGEAVNDVEGLLLSLVYAEPLEALLPLDYVIPHKPAFHVAAEMGISPAALRSLADGGKAISFRLLGVPVGLWVSGQFEGRSPPLLGLRQVTIGIGARFDGGPGDAVVGFVAHGDSLRGVMIRLLWVAVVEALVEIAGLAEWREGYKVGLRKRGLRYS